MRILTVAASAALLFSSTAFAQVKQYGHAGTFEITGTFTLSSTTSDYDEDIGGKQDRSETTITPSGGFFVMDSVEALVDVKISNTSVGDVDGSLLGVGAGAGYFLGIGTIRVGPQLLFRYYSREEKLDGRSLFKDVGPGVTGGLAAKVPIGSGGILITGLNYDYLVTQRKANGEKGDGTVSGYAVTAGFGIYF